MASTTLFVAAGGNCVGALLGGLLAARFGITAPYWVGLVVAIGVSAATWRVFNRAAVARAFTDPPRSRSRPPRSSERLARHPVAARVRPGRVAAWCG
ncbi:hypothetical protein NKG94_13190 [Micromonospora sp. M12]